MTTESSLVRIPDQIIINKILVIRNQKVMLDRDLAELYGITTKRLNEQVKRNQKKFPSNYMFQLSAVEKEDAIICFPHLKALKFSSSLPYAFTIHGSIMLACIINNDRAIEMNIQIVNVFTNLQIAMEKSSDLRQAFTDLQQKTENNTKNIEVVFNYLEELLDKKENQKPRKKIGFKISKDKR